MSAAPGHLRHVWEDRGLTFGDIKDILHGAANGRLEQVSEKLDGMSLTFTWNLMGNEGDELRVARSVGDIKFGGMGANELALKFGGRGNVEQAFNTAFQVLGDAVRCLSSGVKYETFGPSGQVWYSIEVVYAAAPNVINYDTNAVVFHGHPVLEDRLGVVVQVKDPKGMAFLSQHVEQMQKAINIKGWLVRGPALVRLKKLVDGEALKQALAVIDAVMYAADMNDGNTIDDYLRATLTDNMFGNIVGDRRVQVAVVDRMIGSPGAPTLPDIKKLVSKHEYERIAVLVRRGPELLKSYLEPIERAIRTFSTEVLRGLQSTLISDGGAEVDRLKARVNAALAVIGASSNGEAIGFATAQMNRLGTTDNINTSVEGVVFIYKEKAYKFTGSFAPVNQILALCKYGRKGVPPITMGDA